MGNKKEETNKNEFSLNWKEQMELKLREKVKAKIHKFPLKTKEIVNEKSIKS